LPNRLSSLLLLGMLVSLVGWSCYCNPVWGHYSTAAGKKQPGGYAPPGLHIHRPELLSHRGITSFRLTGRPGKAG
jgi:hypothetical protein